jgi:hypothetical protein
VTAIQEEGGYEYASYHHVAESGKEEHHIEPAILFQSLDDASAANSFFGGEWSRIFAEYGSRCEQYGGHWVGHTCHLGRHSHGGGSINLGEDCAAVGAVDVFYLTPPGAILGAFCAGYAIGRETR